MDVLAVGEDHVGAPAHVARFLGVLDDRGVQPVGALDVVVAADRVLLKDGGVRVVEVPLGIAQRIGAHLFLRGGARLQTGVEHWEGHLHRGAHRLLLVTGGRRVEVLARGVGGGVGVGAMAVAVTVSMAVAARGGAGADARVDVWRLQVLMAVQEVLERRVLQGG